MEQSTGNLSKEFLEYISKLDPSFREARSSFIPTAIMESIEEDLFAEFGEEIFKTAERVFLFCSKEATFNYRTALMMARSLHNAKSSENFFKLSETNQLRLSEILTILSEEGSFLHSLIVLLDLCEAELPDLDVRGWHNWGNDYIKRDPVAIETKNHGTITYNRKSVPPWGYLKDITKANLVEAARAPLSETVVLLLTYVFGNDKILEVIDFYRAQYKCFNLFTLVQLLKIWDDKFEELKDYPLEWVNQTFLEESHFAVSWDYKHETRFYSGVRVSQVKTKLSKNVKTAANPISIRVN